MKRFLGLALVGVALTACSDHLTMPTSSLHPSAAARELSDPPPPPIGSSDGFATFDTRSDFVSTAALAAAATADAPVCDAYTTFSFSYKYLLNAPGTNAYLHIDPDDQTRHVTIHQTDKMGIPDAHGMIVGDNFTYTITGTTGGSLLFTDEGRVPGFVSVDLIGTLKIGGTSCTTGATLNLDLTGNQVIG